MKLASYLLPGEMQVRLGAAIDLKGKTHLVDLPEVQACMGARSSAPALPNEMLRLLELGDAGLDAAQSVMNYATAQLTAPATVSQWMGTRWLAEEDKVRLLAPIPRPGKIIMVGSNYKSHVGEAGDAAKDLPAARAEKHTWPAAFSKFPSVVVGHGEPIVYPRHTKQLDYEAELCVVIGKRCKNVNEEDVDDVIAGYTIANDVSLRDIQFAEMRRGLILIGKNSDASSPMGPHLVTKDEIPEPQNLQIKCWVSGELRQNDSTANMTFSIRQLVSYFSRVTLEPGDIIATGTPAGVGIFRNPPEMALLKVGDRIDIEIQPIGRLTNSVVAEG